MATTKTTGRVGKGRAVHSVTTTEAGHHYVACGTTGSGYRAVRVTVTGQAVTCTKCAKKGV